MITLFSGGKIRINKSSKDFEFDIANSNRQSLRKEYNLQYAREMGLFIDT